jgi:hypothetical protein
MELDRALRGVRGEIGRNAADGKGHVLPPG